MMEARDHRDPDCSMCLQRDPRPHRHAGPFFAIPSRSRLKVRFYHRGTLVPTDDYCCPLFFCTCEAFQSHNHCPHVLAMEIMNREGLSELPPVKSWLRQGYCWQEIGGELFEGDEVKKEPRLRIPADKRPRLEDMFQALG